MEILLITSLSGEDVHGTENGKKTGCGINLQKAENITRYIKKGQMTDLKELTCEKCKAVLAKRIIKADKKEMQRLIKEEKQRAKKGIEDENIVPLGNTTARITAPQNSAPEPPKPEPVKPQAPAPQKAPEPQTAPAQQAPVQEQPAPSPLPKTIPGTGVAIDDDLAQFAINVPQKEEEETFAPEKKAEKDILSQFAIEKPDEDPFAAEEETAPQENAVQDDFLAQFAIPAPGAPEPAAEETPVQPEYSAPAQEFDTDGEMNDIFAHPEAPKDIFPKKEEAVQPDELEMNDIFRNPEEPVFSPAPKQETAPAEASMEEPKAEDVSDDDIMKMFSISSGNDDNVEIFAKSVPEETSIYDNDENVVDIDENEVTAAPEEIEPAAEETASESEEEIAAEWDAVANQLFGFEEIPAVEAVPEPIVEPEPVVEAVPEPIAEPEPVVEAVPEPIVEPEPAVEAVPEPIVEPEPAVEAVPEPVVEPEPAVEAVPEPIAEPESVVETVPEPIAEPEPVVEEEPEPAPAAEEAPKPNMHRYTAPVFADEIASRQPAPAPAPVPPQMTAPVQPAPAPEQPVFVTVPQFAGYDMNGQPVYNYVQSQLVGYDQNGQPMFMPLQNMGYPGGMPVPPQMTAPVQPAPAPVQPAPAPVQPAPAPVQPTPAPVQPAPAPVQPTPAPVQPAPAPVQPTPAPAPIPPVQPVRPVQPVYGQTGASGINISKIATEKRRAMPKSVANAVAVSKEKSTKNIFEMEGNQMPVLESIEDILSTMGDESVKKKQNLEKAVPVFEEYKGPTRTASRTSSPAPAKPAEPERPLTKAELKAKKKQEKIDQKFKKDLAKRGF